jgi:hypothetical protein
MWNNVLAILTWPTFDPCIPVKRRKGNRQGSEPSPIQTLVDQCAAILLVVIDQIHSYLINGKPKGLDVLDKKTLNLRWKLVENNSLSKQPTSQIINLTTFQILFKALHKYIGKF